MVVMTTEVLRNMLYAGSRTLGGLGYVVMDEVHYLSDRFRGAVWEEVIIHLPESVALVSLSATVSNAEEFGDWLGTVRGDTEVVVEEHRPVPLWQHVMANGRLYDLFVEERSAEDGTQGQPRAGAAGPRAGPVRPVGRRSGRQRGGRRPRGVRGPSRVDVLERLDAEGLLPAITFIFSRAGCDAAVQQCLHAGLRLLTPEERARGPRVRRGPLRRHPAPRTCTSSATTSGSTGLERGIAAHHAGMLPTFKEVVEELFVRGLVKAVFATETLALGINMPARSVVLERLVKWNGESHADVTPGEYTQLTGRAGRRGIDVEGHAVVVWAAGPRPAGAGRARLDPHLSAAVQLPPVVQHGGQPGRPGRPGPGPRRCSSRRSRSSRPTGRSSGWPGRCARNEEALEGYREAMTCHLGDFEEYAGLRRAIADREAALSRSGAANRRAAGSGVAGGAAARRRHPGARPGAAAAWRSCSTRARRPARTGRGRRCSPPSGRCAGCRWPTSRCRSRRCTGCGSRRRSTRATRPARRDLASTLRNTGLGRRPGRGRRPAAPGPRPPTTPSC